MANSYTYELRLRDLMSAGFKRVSNVASSFHNKMIQSARNVAQATGKIPASISQLGTKLDQLRIRRDSAFSTRQIVAYNQQIKQTERQLQKLKNLPPPSMLDRFRTMRSSILGIIGISGGLGLVLAGFGAIGGIVKLGAELEQTRMSFQTMMGDVDKGNKMLTDLTAMGAATPFGNRELQENAKLLLNFGTAGEKVIPTLRMLGDVSGGNVERLNGLTLAFAQVSSAGKLQGQDLMQMINAGFNPLQQISKMTGQSLGTLKEKMSEGGISAKMVELAFEGATAKGGMFHNMMEKQSQTLGGKWSTFTDTFIDQMAQLGESLAPFLGYLIDIGTKALAWIFKLPKAFKEIYQWMSKNKAVVWLLVIAVGALGAKFAWTKAALLASTIATKAATFWNGSLAASFKAISLAIKNIPIIGWIIAIIALLIAVIVFLVDNWDWCVAKFKAGFLYLKLGATMFWNALKLSFSLIVIEIKILWQRFLQFGQWIGGLFRNIGKSISLALKFDFSGAKKALFAPITTGASAEIKRLEEEGKQKVKTTQEANKKLRQEYEIAANYGKKSKYQAKTEKLTTNAKTQTSTRTGDDIAAEMEGELKNTKSKKGKGKDKMESITTGGQKSFVLNVDIGKVLEIGNQYVTNGKESADELIDQVLDGLTRRLNGTFRGLAES